MDLRDLEHVEIAFALFTLGARNVVDAARTLHSAPVVGDLTMAQRDAVVAAFGDAGGAEVLDDYVKGVLAYDCPVCFVEGGQWCCTATKLAAWDLHVGRRDLLGRRRAPSATAPTPAAPQSRAPAPRP